MTTPPMRVLSSSIEPVVTEKVEAACAGRVPRIPSGQRARRNLAEHASFGEGPGVVAGSDAAVRRRQRGGRSADGE